jgi:ABC-2 type transport system permease protein
MRRSAINILQLGIKELFSLRRDTVMMVLIVYAFTFAVYTPAQHAQMELRNGSVAIADEDRSQLTAAVRDALLPPYFQVANEIDTTEIDAMMDSGRYTFVIDFPPRFQSDALAARKPAVQINVDATAITQTGQGISHIRQVIDQEVQRLIRRGGDAPPDPVEVVTRVKFNPNLETRWFMGVVQLINAITMLSIVLTGAAFMRERERGTVEHLLVLPVRPVEIMTSKVWANGVVILVASALSVKLIIERLLDIPIAGSVPLFLLGTAIYLFSGTALGIFLATVARSMPQFGLLSFPVFMVMILLSGGTTPVESMPPWLQNLMQFSPSTHFVNLAQVILYRGAGLEVVWRPFAAILGIGAIFFATALLRFRKAIMQTS